MAAGKILLVGMGLAALAVVVLSKSASASSSSSSGGTPPPTPGPGATVEDVPSGMGPGIPAVTRTSWHVAADPSGQRAGTMVLVKSKANANDWVLAFKDELGGAGILTYGSTPMSGLIAQEVAAGF